MKGRAKLRPAFHAKGTITAGNSSQRSDGAAAVVVMERGHAEELGLKPLLRFVGFAVAGVRPEVMGIGPLYAIPKVLKLTGLSLSDIDLIEFNEAFASQALAVIRELGLNLKKLNVNGGAIALGHPMGATGTKLTVQLMHEMKRRGSRYGMVTMCIGGGMGAAGRTCKFEPSDVSAWGTTHHECLKRARQEQTLVYRGRQFEKRFSQRSSTILALLHGALAERQELPSCFVYLAEHATAVLKLGGKLSPRNVVRRKGRKERGNGHARDTRDEYCT
jgi:hypothetical protein